MNSAAINITSVQSYVFSSLGQVDGIGITGLKVKFMFNFKRNRHLFSRVAQPWASPLAVCRGDSLSTPLPKAVLAALCYSHPVNTDWYDYLSGCIFLMQWWWAPLVCLLYMCIPWGFYLKAAGINKWVQQEVKSVYSYKNPLYVYLLATKTNGKWNLKTLMIRCHEILGDKFSKIYARPVCCKLESIAVKYKTRPG